MINYDKLLFFYCFFAYYKDSTLRPCFVVLFWCGSEAHISVSSLPGWVVETCWNPEVQGMSVCSKTFSSLPANTIWIRSEHIRTIDIFQKVMWIDLGHLYWMLSPPFKYINNCWAHGFVWKWATPFNPARLCIGNIHHFQTQPPKFGQCGISCSNLT